jgi:dTDP-4-dehydrorhamnose 3,5-epimerase-like enzyme
MKFRFELMAILDVLLVIHCVVRDQSGFFLESFREEAFLKIGIPRLVQGNCCSLRN